MCIEVVLQLTLSFLWYFTSVPWSIYPSQILLLFHTLLLLRLYLLSCALPYLYYT